MPIIRTILIHSLIALAVAMAVWISSFYHFPQHVTPIVVLGSGIILGLLFRMGAKVLPALFIGLVASHRLLIGYQLLTSVWVSTTMLITGWLALSYMRKFTGNDIVDRPIHNYLHFYIAAMLISPVANVLLDLPLFWLIELSEKVDDVRLFIFSYTFGEALGSLVFAPAIALFGQRFHGRYAYADYPNVRNEKILWLAASFVLIILTLLLGRQYFFAGLLDAELLLYPMIIWSALRLGVIFTNIAVAIIAYTVFTFHFFGIAGTSGEMTIPQVLGTLLLVITLAILGQLVAAATLERRKKEALLEQAAYHDPITGLPNARSLHKSMEASAIKKPSAVSHHMLGYVSICNYQTLVQGYGLEAQSALYQQFGGFLKLHTKADIEIFRVSGPAFALLIEDQQDNQALTVMNHLAAQVKRFKFVWQQRPMHINAVYSLVPANFIPAEVHGPLDHASALAEEAYQQGNIGTVMINRQDHDRCHRKARADWLGKINAALANNMFFLVAQPIVPIESEKHLNTELYFEVLLRLQDAAGRSELPEEFMPHAEAFNLMPNIDRWVVRHALQWLTSTAVDLQHIGCCSINLSGQSIADPVFCADIARLIEEYHVPAQKLCFEITETAAIASMHCAAAFVTQLQQLGCKVALDDFGSGLCSFGYLKKLSVDILKIDGAFIHNIPQSKTDYAIVDAVWRVAQTMNLTTVAEYVESEEILQFLADMGVTYAQGYYTGRPLPLDQLLLKGKANNRSSRVQTQ